MADAEHVKVLKAGVEVWNKWRSSNRTTRPDLREADLREADLSGVNLSEANLSGANLSQADLPKADLSGAGLIRADLREANMSRADMSGVNLSEANLRGANLIRADLSGANLSGTNLSQADLRGANVRKAKARDTEFGQSHFGATVLAAIDLSGAKGLESVQHAGPSTIGLDAFFESKGKIPDVFLRGAGVPEVFIQYASALIGKGIEFYSCFISYSHADKAFARRLHDALQGRGIRCWLDEKQLLPGDHIHQQIDEAVRLWDKVLLCCSEKSLTSWWVDKELSKALKKEEQLWKERGKQVLAIIPLDLDGYVLDPKWENWKRQHLTDRVACNFTGWDKDNTKFDQRLELVIKALRADGGAREKPPKPKL